MAVDFDALVVAVCHATFGETVYYYPGAGPMLTLPNCPFDDKFVETSFSDGAEVADTRTIVNVRAAIVPAEPVKGELFRIRGVLYVVNEVEPDGFGDIRIYLGLTSDVEAQRIPLPPS